MKAALRNRVSTGGCWFAAIYALMVVVVFAYTAATTKPGNVGLDWVPFSMVAMPWSGLDARLLFPGFIANTALLYLLGTLLQSMWRGVKEWG